jgi:hypothetical protein
MIDGLAPPPIAKNNLKPPVFSPKKLESSVYIWLDKLDYRLFLARSANICGSSSHVLSTLL